jgi:hypothetical protein
VVVLPAPFGPSSPNEAGDLQVDVVHRDVVTEPVREPGTHLLLLKTSSVLVGADAWVGPMLCAMAAGRGARARGECCGMVIDRAAASGLYRYEERVRAAGSAAGEQPGQRRGDPRAAPPALGPAAAARSGQGCGSPRVIGRCWRRCSTGSPGTCSTECTWWCARIPCCAGTAMWRHAGPPGGPGPAPGPAAHRALDPRPGVAAGPGESRPRISPGARRAAVPGVKGRRLHRLGDLARRGDRPGARAQSRPVGWFPALPGPRWPVTCSRRSPCPGRGWRARGDRARQPDNQDPGCHRPPGGVLGGTGCQEPRDGPGRCRLPGTVRDQRPGREVPRPARRHPR